MILAVNHQLPLNGNNMKYLSILILMITQLSCAVDNPEAPNYVAEFESRIKVYEDYISKTAATTLEFSTGYGDLYTALDTELNSAYKQLMLNLGEEEKQSLKASQRQWIKYRDAEFKFIEKAITRDKFGSSFILSAGSHRTTLLKSRVKEFVRTLWQTSLGVIIIFFTLLLDDNVNSYQNYYQSLFFLFIVHFLISTFFRELVLTIGKILLEKGFNSKKSGGN